jgi:FKBP-type peptidyl-prolyl cis-trans isomerase SlyD
MAIGSSKDIVLSPKEGYGEIDPQAVVEVPRDQLPADIPLEVGLPLQVQDTDGSILDARILRIGNDTVQLDFNHPLAGQELRFQVKVVDLRLPSPEEIQQGHVLKQDVIGE